MLRVLRISLVLALLDGDEASAAQDPVQEHVVITATATPVRFAELSRSVLVLTREQIARLPVRSIDELLGYLAPVDVRRRGLGGTQADFSIRGASFGQTLIMVDGVRLNDAQSGHHNGDIPVALEDVARIELLAGPGAALHGADAFGGAVNIITRRDEPGQSAGMSAGGDAFLDAHVRLSRPVRGRVQAINVAFNRSDGFMPSRDFRTLTIGGRSRLGGRTLVGLSHVDKAFGANGFYGPSPSREWTTQTLATIERGFGTPGGWSAKLVGAYRTHGDRFLWDERRPAQLENVHRTHAASVAFSASRALSAATRLHLGADGGHDWIRSSNLGDHGIARGSFVAELRHQAGARAHVTSSLRYDGYGRFGRAWSPAVAAHAWVAAPVKVRVAAGHAFRVPTFTELYYRDPAHLASGDLEPERGWSYEAGVDWLPARGWLVGATAFARRDRDVIDWVRATPRDRWRTANVRRVATEGVELFARRALGGGAIADLQYSWLTSSADPLGLLSKYVLDYAPHRVVGSLSAPLPGRLDVGGRLGFTRRVDGREHALLDVRLGRRIGAVRVFVEGTNLFDAEYEEVRGVAMPGRWLRAGIEAFRF